jgi:hypothetical protein
MTAMRMGWGAGARGALVLLGAAVLGAAGWAGQAAAATAGTQPAKPVPVSSAPSASRPCGTQAKPGAYKHVIWIWMENKSYGTIIGSAQSPYVNTVAHECGLATNYHNVTHPSLPNYIAATSGLSLASLNNISDVSCGIPALVISPSTTAGTQSAALFNHYSLLGTAEQLLRLSKLGQAANYPTMVSAFNL